MPNYDETPLLLFGQGDFTYELHLHPSPLPPEPSPAAYVVTAFLFAAGFAFGAWLF